MRAVPAATAVRTAFGVTVTFDGSDELNWNGFGARARCWFGT